MNNKFEIIKEKLEASACDAFELTETVVKGFEFYFIRHRLDQNRFKELTTFNVNVYKEIVEGDNKFLGKASGDIYPTESDEEIDKKISNLLFQASLVKNPYYELNAPKTDEEKYVSKEETKKTISRLLKNSQDFIEMISSVNETENEDLNSYEIFINEISKKFVNSNGVTYELSYPSSTLEYVVNARRKEGEEVHEVELYRIGDYGTCNKAELKQQIENTLTFAKDRLVAEPTPKVKGVPVVLSTDVQVEIHNYFKTHMNSQYKVMKITDWESGKPISDSFEGDRVTVKAVSSLPNSSYDFAFDNEGAEIKDRFLIKDGVACEFYGSKQFCDYLGLKDNSNVYNVEVFGGKKSADELKSGDYFEIVEFSDFQVNEMSGDIMGEIRLGYLHMDGKVMVVTGGSVSGNMVDAVRKIEFSKEQTQYNNYLIPSVTKISGLTITGVA